MAIGSIYYYGVKYFLPYCYYSCAYESRTIGINDTKEKSKLARKSPYEKFKHILGAPFESSIHPFVHLPFMMRLNYVIYMPTVAGGF
jgi:hypothetical protein